MTTAAVPAASGEVRTRLRTLGLVGMLFVLGVVAPLAVASRYGALGIPRSDDWSYLVTLFRWVEHGRLSFNDWVSMTLVGQLLLAAPLVAVAGRSVWAVQVFAALLGFVGLLALAWLGRVLIPHGRGAVLLAATIAVGPLWAPLASTFMTDVPAFTVQMLSLVLAVAAFRHAPLSITRFAAALAVGFLGISIRQYGAIPVLAIILAVVWSLTSTRDWTRLRIALLLSGVTAVATGALLAWWTSLPDALSLAPQPPGSSVVAVLGIQAAGFLRLTGLLLAPVILLAGPARIVRRAWLAGRGITTAAVTLVAAWLLVTYVRVPRVPFVGNYVDRRGVLGTDVLIGDRVPNGQRVAVMRPELFDLLVLVGSVGGILLALAAVPFFVRGVARLAARDLELSDPSAAVLVLTLVGFVVAYAAASVTGLPVFDRYALPAIPLAGLLLLRSSASTRSSEPATSRWIPWVAPGAAVAVLGLVGLAFSTDSASFDATRWDVATSVTELGYRPLQVYGGFEWLAYHRQRGPRLSDTPEERRRFRAQDFRGLCVDLVVNPSARVASRGIARGEVRGIAHAPVPIVAVRNDRPCG